MFDNFERKKFQIYEIWDGSQVEFVTQISDNIIICFFLVVDMELGEGKVSIEKWVSIECTKPILFFTLMVDYQISYFWDLKTILFANWPPKTQVSLFWLY